jgi:hypothetical protein
MGLINVDKIEPGMVLSEKVLTSKRMMLLPEGTVLTAGHLVTFKTWGVSEVNIVGGDDSSAAEEMTPEERDALKRKVNEIFKYNNLNGKFTKKLHELACEHARNEQ